MNRLMPSVKFRLRYVFVLALFTTSMTKSFAITDTSKNIYAAVNESKVAHSHTNTSNNIIFPTVLLGNEEESLAYIEKFSINRRMYIIRTYNKGKAFFPKVSSVLQKHHLPTELKVLLPLESAFNGNAVSKAGAVGYWQFMDEVAKEYGLKYAPGQKTATPNPIAKKGSKKPTVVKDDRKNFNKSTYAAARYLKDRSRNLNNDLLLIVASYNWGVGNVWNAMKRTGLANPNFWDIKKYLPSETSSYVMNFITLNVIFHNYENFSANRINFVLATNKSENAEQIVLSTISERGL